jgi:hypothetical protein
MAVAGKNPFGVGSSALMHVAGVLTVLSERAEYYGYPKGIQIP